MPPRPAPRCIQCSVLPPSDSTSVCTLHAQNRQTDLCAMSEELNTLKGTAPTVLKMPRADHRFPFIHAGYGLGPGGKRSDAPSVRDYLYPDTNVTVDLL